MKNFLLWLATLGPLGSFRGSGTFATVATLPLVLLLSLLPYKLYALFILVAIVIALLSIRFALPQFPTQTDPAEIVVDEVVGCLITFLLIPLTWKRVLLGVVIFRFFDIKKPLFLKTIERFGGATGILFDDVAAGIMANLMLCALVYLTAC